MKKYKNNKPIQFDNYDVVRVKVFEPEEFDGVDDRPDKCCRHCGNLHGLGNYPDCIKDCILHRGRVINLD